MKDKLLPCPFCGQIPSSFYMNQGYKWGGVECTYCGVRGPDVRTSYDESENAPWRQDAIKEWNTRASKKIDPVDYSNFQQTMKLCPKCGNKRCPHATNKMFECTNSNEPGQPGSAYR